MTNDKEKADVLNAYFYSVFTNMASPQAHHISQTSRRLSGNEAAPTVEEELRSSYSHLDIHKLMGPPEMYPRVFEELAGQSLLSPWNGDGANTLGSCS